MSLAGGRCLVLCADDYGISPGVSRGIVELVERGRLSATSCMTTSRHWPEHAGWLKPHRDRIDVGLHLTLTNLAPLGSMPTLAPNGSMPSLGRLIRRAQLRLLDQEEVAAELGRQVDAFEAAFGRLPAFLDGHQHVHQLPVVRRVTIDLFWRRLRGQGYVRVTREPLFAILNRGADIGRALVIAALGRRFAAMVRRSGIPANDSFRGVHDFSGRTPYATLFRRFLQGSGERPLIMCHPGHADADLAEVDPVTTARDAEWQYFSGDVFPDDLARAGFTLGRFAA